MLERLLLGILSLGLPDQSHDEDNATPTQKAETTNELITRLQNSAKLHVGMLTISLIIGLAFGGYMGYSCWAEKNNFRAYLRNLVIAFVCRIFFSILFDGVVILGSNVTVEGANTLLAFECICQSFVIAFWLMLTVYLHARVQRKFNSEPTLTLYEYGIPGVAVFFALVWIFGLQSEYPSAFWWFMPSPLPQWIVNSLRLLYLLIQLGFVVDIGRMIMKTSLDADSISLLRKSGAIMAALILLFWLQFGLSLGRLPLATSQSYQYFDYFIDGSQGGLVCLALFFFDLWVPTFLNNMPSIVMENEEAQRWTQEVLVTGSRGVETKDKVFKTKETGRWKTVSDAEAVAEFRDVMYSTVVEPHRLKKTLDLYKRLNVLPNSQVTVLDGDQFYDCQARCSIVSETGDSEKVDFRSVISDDSRSPSRENSRFKTPKLSDQVQKRNAFYASKYLILDSKEGDFPKFLETRPFVASVEKKSAKEEGSDGDFFSNLDTIIPDELVNKWLDDSSKANLRERRKSRFEQPGQELGEGCDRKLANERDSNEDLVQNLAQKVGSESTATSDRKSGGAINASESTNATTTDSNKGAIEQTLIPTEIEVLQPPNLRRHSQRTYKRKSAETDENDPPNDPESLESTSGEVAAETEGSSEKREASEAHKESKQRNSTQGPDEYQPRPIPRKQRSTSTTSGKDEEPPCGKVQSTESKFPSSAVSSTANPMESPLTSFPDSESPMAAQSGGFSDVIYSTFNALLNLGDGLFKSRSSNSFAEGSEVPSEWEDDIHKNKAAMSDGKMTGALKNAEDFYIPANAQTLHADVGPFDNEAKPEEGETKSLQNPVMEAQSLERYAQEEVEGREKSSIGQMQKPQQTYLQPIVSPKAETVGVESSSELNSIERVDSFSVDKYQAELKANREKFDHVQHLLANNFK